MRTRVFSSKPLLFSMLLLLCLSYGCLPPGPVPVDTVVPVAVEEIDATKSITLSRIASDISVGERIGIIYDWTPYYMKLGEKHLNEFNKTFFRTLKNFNYNILGDPENMFEESGPEAELQVGIRIIDITFNAVLTLLLNWDSSATIDIEFQIFNGLDKKLVYRKTLSGAGNYEADDLSGDALYDAFQNAVDKLLVDPDFQQVVAQDAPSSAETIDADILSAFSPRFAAEGSRPIQDVPQSVVTVLIGAGHGSGFVIADGLILTNRHVVGEASRARILTQDGKTYDGTVVARDAQRDVAAIFVEGLGLPPLLVRQEPMAVGEDIYAVGSPLDITLSGTVTRGIVSSHRTMGGVSWIQGDASINHGNSGGPIVDRQGNLAGISTLGQANSQGIFYYGPINDVMKTLGLQAK